MYVVEINYGIHEPDYKAHVTFTDLAPLKEAALETMHRPNAWGKTGEWLIAELLLACRGYITEIKRFKDDLPNNGPEEQPAIQIFQDGNLFSNARFEKGEAVEGKKGEAHYEEFDARGNITKAANWQFDNRVYLGVIELQDYQKKMHDLAIADAEPIVNRGFGKKVNILKP